MTDPISSHPVPIRPQGPNEDRSAVARPDRGTVSPGLAALLSAQSTLAQVTGAKGAAGEARLGPALPPPRQVGPDALSGAADKLNATSGQAPVDITELFTLLHKIGNELSKASHEAEVAQQDLQINKLKDAASEIEKAAKFALAAGIVSGTMTIAGGVTSAVGAVKASRIVAKETTVDPAETTQSELASLKGSAQKGQWDASAVPEPEEAALTPKELKDLGLADAVELVDMDPGNIGKARPPQASAVPLVAQGAVPASNPAPDDKAASSQDDMLEALQKKFEDLSDGGAGLKNMAAYRKADVVSETWKAAGTVITGAGETVKSGLEFGSQEHLAQKANKEAEAQRFAYAAQNAQEHQQKMDQLAQDIRQTLDQIQQTDYATKTKFAWNA
jgi:hypothetical protein